LISRWRRRKQKKTGSAGKRRKRRVEGMTVSLSQKQKRE